MAAPIEALMREINPMNHRPRLLSIWLAALSIVLAASPAAVRAEVTSQSEKPDSYQQHYDEATRLFAKGKYALAIKEYRLAWGIKQSAATLFSLGVCNQRLRNFGDAVGYYAEYMRREPKPRPEILKEMEVLLSQMKALSEDVQKKKEEVVERLCSFGVSDVCQGRPRIAIPTSRDTIPEPAQRTGSDPLVSGGARATHSQPGGEGQSGRPAVIDSSSSSPERTAEPTPVYKKGWFWGAVVGGAAVAGLAIGLGTYFGTRPRNAVAPDGVPVQPVTLSLINLTASF